MFFKTQTITFDLSPTSIDRASEWFVENQQAIDIKKEDCLRMRLVFEEALLNFAERFGADQQVTAYVEKKMGRFRLRLMVEGDRYNPLKRYTGEEAEPTASLFVLLGTKTQYQYTTGANIVRMPLPHPTMNPVLKILIAIAVGIALGALGNVMIPDPLQEKFTDTVLGPIADMWVRLLQAISGPIIFFTALTAAFGTKRISEYGGSRLFMLARYFIISAIVVVLALLCTVPFMSLDINYALVNREWVTKVLSNILDVVPDNLLEPFGTANTPQLLLVAIVSGYALAAMESQLAELKAIIQQANLLGLTIAKRACDFVPYFVGLLLCLKIWSHNIDLLGLIWMPLAWSLVLSVIMFAVVLLTVSLKCHVNPMLLMRKLSGPFIEALKTGSLDYASVSELADSCKQLLGIDEDFARAVLPQGLVLYMPTSAIGIIVFVMFAASTQGIYVDQMWILSAAALSVILAVATPPLNGANLLAFVVAFAYLGISSDAFLDVMVFDIVFGVFCIALDQTMLQLETILQADNMGLLNESALRAPLEQADAG